MNNELIIECTRCGVKDDWNEHEDLRFNVRLFYWETWKELAVYLCKDCFADLGKIARLDREYFEDTAGEAMNYDNVSKHLGEPLGICYICNHEVLEQDEHINWKGLKTIAHTECHEHLQSKGI